MYLKVVTRLLLTGALGLTFLGCAATSPVSAPTSSLPSDDQAAGLIPTATLTPGVDNLVALYKLTIEPGTLAVSVENVGAERAAQASPQAKAYDLELFGAINDGMGNPFLTIRGDNQFKVTNVSDVGIGMLVTFTHAHPIASPNYTTSSANFYTACADCLCYSATRPSPLRPSPQEECLRAKDFGTVRPNALNRSDLSYSGRAIFLTNILGDSSTYFGTQKADIKGVVNPAGYLDPRSIINAPTDPRHPGLTNTLFPYVLLADEVKNNRTGVSNLGVMTGNYDAAGGGWQRANIGTNFKSWTGYDMMHAGQVVSNSVILKATPAGGYTGYVALTIKYTDPRGAASLFWRWPTPTPDPVQFAYRLPFAALDASVILPPSQTISINAPAGSTAAVSIKVRDWDRTATEAAGFDLSLEPDVAKVQAGASGNCVVTLDVPALAATPFTLAYQSGSGLPGAEATYMGTVTNVLGTASSGDYFGLLKVVDPEANDASAGSYRFGINNPPTYTNAVAADALALTNYQVVPFKINLAKPVISNVSNTGCPTPVAGGAQSGAGFIATASNNPTAWSWNFGGGATPNTSTSPAPFVLLGMAGEYDGTVTATNAAGTSDVFNFCFTVGGSVPVVGRVDPACPDTAGTPGQAGVIFNGVATGFPTTWLWVFGGGAEITANGTTANPLTTLTDIPGEYEAFVIASNASGESVPFSFCVKVAP